MKRKQFSLLFRGINPDHYADLTMAEYLMFKACDMATITRVANEARVPVQEVLERAMRESRYD